jgi:hypothetical protein
VVVQLIWSGGRTSVWAICSSLSGRPFSVTGWRGSPSGFFSSIPMTMVPLSMLNAAMSLALSLLEPSSRFRSHQ